MPYGRVVLSGLIVFGAGLGSAWAQFAVTDPATTARNAVIAKLKTHLVDTVRAQDERLRRMARRLSGTNLQRYALAHVPPWQTQADVGAVSYGEAYRAALIDGDSTGDAYRQAARTRQEPRDAFTALPSGARAIVERALATLDAADSAIIAGTHQSGLLRHHGRREVSALDTLESDVVDPSQDQSTTAVLDKISGAVLLETRQKQARLQYLTSIVEQLVIDNKRARDTEAAVLNMQVHRARGRDGREGGALLTGASTDLRTWRQP